MIRFEKVSFEEFTRALNACGIALSQEKAKEYYDAIRIPTRGTPGSAGYDIATPVPVRIPDGGQYVVVPTGIRFVTDRSDLVLLCVPRSGLGFKNGLRLRNTLGVIDSDFQFSDTTGHFLLKLGADEPCDLPAGKACVQGIFVPFLTVDDEATDGMSQRTGGFGSTGR